VPNPGHYEALCTEIIRLLQEERERRGISRYAVAKFSGISQSMLSLVERRFRNPSLELMLRTADAIGADFPGVITQAQKNIARIRQPSHAKLELLKESKRRHTKAISQ
jgi:transcriptional regulator with XRE-family HTH domain